MCVMSPPAASIASWISSRVLGFFAQRVTSPPTPRMRATSSRNPHSRTFVVRELGSISSFAAAAFIVGEVRIASRSSERYVSEVRPSFCRRLHASERSA